MDIDEVMKDHGWASIEGSLSSSDKDATDGSIVLLGNDIDCHGPDWITKIRQLRVTLSQPAQNTVAYRLQFETHSPVCTRGGLNPKDMGIIVMLRDAQGQELTRFAYGWARGCNVSYYDASGSCKTNANDPLFRITQGGTLTRFSKDVHWCR